MMRGDNVAIVTGAGSGIGEATAHLLAERGSHVVVWDIDDEGAARTVDSIHRSGAEATLVVADVSNESAVEFELDRLQSSGLRPDVLVNSAGVLHVKPALETTLEAFDRVVRINLRGVFVLSTALARRLSSDGRTGSIVNVSSIHAVLSEPNASAYTASKGGVEALTRTFASEWARLGIRVNAVRPGATRTALTDAIYTPDVLRAIEERVPMRRPAVPAEIASVICFLASDEASYMTGTCLDVDGGYIMDGSLPRTAYGS